MKKWWGAAAGTLAALSVATVYTCYALVRPVTTSDVSLEVRQPTAGQYELDKLGLHRAAAGYIDPSSGEIQCRDLGTGENYTKPRATASLAKMITVQVVLNKRPLKANEAGPIITMSADDEARYWNTVQSGGSYGRVVAGEQISERQLIEGIVLASANNMADSLAIWAFGSMDNYHAAAREWLASHGLRSTTLGGDASGFDPATKSTPMDLCKVMLLTTKQPALVSIMGMHEATMPTGDVLTSTNKLMGQHGIFGGKTGYTDEAGRGMMVAARQDINGFSVVTAAVNLSNDSYPAALDGAGRLAEAIPHNLKIWSIKQGQKVGELKAPWADKATAITVSRGATVPYWADQAPKISLQTSHGDYDSLSQQTVVGQLSVGNDQINLVPAQNVAAASVEWRLGHVF